MQVLKCQLSWLEQTLFQRINLGSTCLEIHLNIWNALINFWTLPLLIVVREKIICPCQKCNFNKWQCREVVYECLILKPFPIGYKVWLLHGERTRLNVTNETHVMPQEDNESCC